MVDIRIQSRKEAKGRQNLKLCSSCFKEFKKSNGFYRKADQYYNGQDQNATESEVDQAEKDTCYQSSLLQSKSDPIAHFNC